MILDLFSGGGGGWCLAARKLEFPSVGIEWDGPACGTRAMVGLPTIRADVSQYPPEPFIGKVEGICGGPPCQSFSSAGKRRGLDDPRGQLVHEPMRWVRIIRPRWVALEQVPEVIGYWRWIARELRELGYSTWTGVLNAADYGVPQVRNRAILLASLDRRAVPPEPTHSKTGHDEMFGAGRARWVSMAEALGWSQPAGFVLSTGTNSAVTDHTAAGHEPYERAIDRPAPVVDTKAARWKVGPPGHRPKWVPGLVLRTGHTNANGPTFNPFTRPARTIASDAPKWSWERPATTIPATHANGTGGRGMVAPPGHHTTSTYTEDKGAVPVELWELGVLQGFAADHPWQPPYVAAQIGNAIPPPLAEACLRAVAA